jgi:hypothetical protein
MTNPNRPPTAAEVAIDFPGHGAWVLLTVRTRDGRPCDLDDPQVGRVTFRSADGCEVAYAAPDDAAGGWWPPAGRLLAPPCQCADRACPCRGRCCRRATTTLFRVDMEDRTGTPFCDGCAADAWESGLFSDGADDVLPFPIADDQPPAA